MGAGDEEKKAFSGNCWRKEFDPIGKKRRLSGILAEIL